MPLQELRPRKTIGPYTVFERWPKPSGMTKYMVAKDTGNPAEIRILKDFGRYSAAIRWCKSQCPREVPHVVIVLGDQSKRQSRSELAVSNVPVRFTLIEGPYRSTGDALVDPEQVEEFTKPK